MLNKLIAALMFSLIFFGFYSQGQEKMTPAWNRQKLFQHALELAAQSKEGKNEKIFAVLNLYTLLIEDKVKAARIETMFFAKEIPLDKDSAIILMGSSLALQNKFEEALSTINYFIDDEEQRQSAICEVIQSAISEDSLNRNDFKKLKIILNHSSSNKEENKGMGLPHALLYARIGEVERALSLASKLESHDRDKVLKLAVNSLVSDGKFEEAVPVASQINKIDTKLDSFIFLSEYSPAAKLQAVELLDNHEKSIKIRSSRFLVSYATRLHKLGMNIRATEILKEAEGAALAEKDGNIIFSNLLEIAEKFNQIGYRKNALAVLDQAGNLIPSCEKSVSMCASLSADEVKFKKYCRIAGLSAKLGEMNKSEEFLKSALEYHERINAFPSDNLELAKTYYLLNKKERSLEILRNLKFTLSNNPEEAILYRAWMDLFEIASTKQDYDFAMELMKFCDEDSRFFFCLSLLLNYHSSAL